MKLNPKITLGVSVCTLLLIFCLLLFYLKIRTGNQNWFYLNSAKNQFKISFQINSKSSDDFESVLKSLNLPLNIEKGVEFKLDPISSAQLTYLSPIKSSIKFSPKTVYFEGTTSHYLGSFEKKPESIIVPNSTIFAIFASDFNTFLDKKYQFTTDQKNWLNQNLASPNGQYLAIFAPQDFAIYFENNQINLNNLISISKESSSESIPAENLPSNNKTYLLNVTNKDNKEPTSIVLFQTGKWNILTTTNDAVQEIITAQNSKGSNLDFTQASDSGSASFVLLYQNNEDKLSKELLASLISISASNNLSEAKLQEVLYNVSKASFALKQDHFSGLIKFK